jgi:hypothetical protein
MHCQKPVPFSVHFFCGPTHIYVTILMPDQWHTVNTRGEQNPGSDTMTFSIYIVDECEFLVFKRQPV